MPGFGRDRRRAQYARLREEGDGFVRGLPRSLQDFGRRPESDDGVCREQLNERLRARMSARAAGALAPGSLEASETRTQLRCFACSSLRGSGEGQGPVFDASVPIGPQASNVRPRISCQHQAHRGDESGRELAPPQYDVDERAADAPLPQSANGWMVSNCACAIAAWTSAGMSLRLRNAARSFIKSGTYSGGGGTKSACPGLNRLPPIQF